MSGIARPMSDPVACNNCVAPPTSRPLSDLHTCPACGYICCRSLGDSVRMVRELARV